MREIKFRAWHKSRCEMLPIIDIEYLMTKGALVTDYKDFVENIYPNIMQYTGLKDKNGIEIYEYMELDNQFEVSFSHGSYILTNISNGDIMTLHKYIKDKNGQVKITKEYTKI